MTTDADRELAAILRSNPELRVVGEPDHAPTPTQQAIRAAAVAKYAEPTEEDMQIAVIAWADSQIHPALRWLFHVPNGGHRDPATGGRLKAMGVRAGVVDLLLPWRTGDYIGLAIEMKRKPNKPSAEQLEWLDHLQAQGWHTEVCYSAALAIDTIKAYLDIA